MLASERHALELDAAGPLPARRAEFCVPPFGAAEAAYLAGNSLGLQPKALRARLGTELDDWARFGVEGHTEAARPWLPYHELLRGPAARLVGARPEEVVVMNSLTINLHLLMVSFYRPTPRRHAIVIEDSAFPSDSYAVRSQAAFHGFDPGEAIVRLAPRPGEAALRTDDVVRYLGEEGERVALVLLGAVNYFTGELFDIDAITAAGQAAGAVVGWDLAHAAGNVPLRRRPVEAHHQQVEVDRQRVHHDHLLRPGAHQPGRGSAQQLVIGEPRARGFGVPLDAEPGPVVQLGPEPRAQRL
ncbi:MAG TPA: hypothetical protein VFE26_01080, partial [Trebonia sp.]|nr:hypothetical protein [Trebonia sp.]